MKTVVKSSQQSHFGVHNHNKMLRRWSLTMSLGESHHQRTCLSRAHCHSMPHLAGARGALQRPLMSAAGKMERSGASLSKVHFMAKPQKCAGYRRAATHQAAMDTISSAG